MKRKYDINQIDECMLRYANAYIKQVVNNAQKNYFRNCLKLLAMTFHLKNTMII